MKLLFLFIKISIVYAYPCIVFYTGGSNLISCQLYSKFLSELDNIDIYKIPFNTDKNIDNFYNNLKQKYTSVNLIGHSSGCVTAVNDCNKNVNNLILLDPVKSLNWDSRKNVNYLNNLIIINAEKSYKWSYIPPFVPFIPFLKVDIDDININKNKIKIVKCNDYGHSDIINNPWRDIMHYSRISIGYNKRYEINKYHKFLSNIIKYFLYQEKEIE